MRKLKRKNNKIIKKNTNTINKMGVGMVLLLLLLVVGLSIGFGVSNNKDNSKSPNTNNNNVAFNSLVIDNIDVNNCIRDSSGESPLQQKINYVGISDTYTIHILIINKESDKIFYKYHLEFSVGKVESGSDYSNFSVYVYINDFYFNGVEYK